ncbi:alkaline phosphatase family protein [Streptomyces sp. NBC_01210]|uniref:alkaline phosphatase family protein n=1 Tax=Streptomyces sp. NBC_01210 TaxID=2903774 RepID=UPI002E0D80B2
MQHAVMLMQENRSIDHYFGTLKGVRGFQRPKAIQNEDGMPVWYQKCKDHPDGHGEQRRHGVRHHRDQQLRSLIAADIHPRPRGSDDDFWNVEPAHHWYDLTATANTDNGFPRRFAGHMETGRSSYSDPRM